MKKVLLSLLLLHAVPAFAQPTAQPTVSAEISSDSLPLTNLLPFLPAPAVAMAKDRTGVAIAWLMPGTTGDRISVVRLDMTGHFTGQVQPIPAASAQPFNVVAPSIAAAPAGDGFTLVWLESSATPYAVYCQLDRNLKPSTPVVLLEMAQPVTAPAIVRSGKTTWISAGGFAWELGDDGSLSAPLNAGMTASDMTVATDFPQIVALGHFTRGFICPCSGYRWTCNCPLVPVTAATLQFTSLYSITASTIFDYETDAAPAVSSNGRDIAIVWFQGAHVKGGQVVMSQLLPPSFAEFPAAVNQSRVLGSFGPESGATRPDIASDGARYIVVWRTAMSDGTHDVVGASIDRTGNIIPLSIATSAADERDPSVVSLGDGNFLVAYEKLSAGERRIAGRLVTFVSRPHAVR